MKKELRRFGNQGVKPAIPEDLDLHEILPPMEGLGVPLDRRRPDDYD